MTRLVTDIRKIEAKRAETEGRIAELTALLRSSSDPQELSKAAGELQAAKLTVTLLDAKLAELRAEQLQDEQKLAEGERQARISDLLTALDSRFARIRKATGDLVEMIDQYGLDYTELQQLHGPSAYVTPLVGLDGALHGALAFWAKLPEAKGVRDRLVRAAQRQVELAQAFESLKVPPMLRKGHAQAAQERISTAKAALADARAGRYPRPPDGKAERIRAAQEALWRAFEFASRESEQSEAQRVAYRTRAVGMVKDAQQRLESARAWQPVVWTLDTEQLAAIEQAKSERYQTVTLHAARQDQEPARELSEEERAAQIADAKRRRYRDPQDTRRRYT